MDDLTLLKVAYSVALDSNDPSTQNGAILVTSNCGMILQEACNNFAIGVAETSVRWERQNKTPYVVHAECAVIYGAARRGLYTHGLTMYACWASCAECSKAIINAGIKELVAHDAPFHHARPDWQKSIDIADGMLMEAGVKLRRVPGQLGCKPIRFGGVLVNP